MNRAPHFSLWLPLPSPAQERFQALVAQLAAGLARDAAGKIFDRRLETGFIRISAWCTAI